MCFTSCGIQKNSVDQIYSAYSHCGLKVNADGFCSFSLSHTTISVAFQKRVRLRLCQPPKAQLNCLPNITFTSLENKNFKVAPKTVSPCTSTLSGANGYGRSKMLLKTMLYAIYIATYTAVYNVNTTIMKMGQMKSLTQKTDNPTSLTANIICPDSCVSIYSYRTYLGYTITQLQWVEIYFKPIVKFLYLWNNMLHYIKPHLEST